MTIKGVLLDSGGVLVQPRSGRWNPRFDFEEIVRRRFPHISDAQLVDAIAAGDRFMAACTETPEYDEFHRVILRALELDATDDFLAELKTPLHPAEIVELFDDVLPTLTAIRGRGLPIGIVSDAWSTLPDMHAALGIREFFDAYAISQDVGCHKPDPRMYRHASDALGLAPEECFFVDDDPELVAAAIDLGYTGAALCRDGSPSEVPTIRSLGQILDFV